jgi:hypothetical protein
MTRPLTPSELVDLENLLTIVEEHESAVLAIGRHANLCQWLYEHGYGYYHNDKELAKKVARQLVNGGSAPDESDEDLLSRYEDEL